MNVEQLVLIAQPLIKGRRNFINLVKQNMHAYNNWLYNYNYNSYQLLTGLSFAEVGVGTRLAAGNLLRSSICWTFEATKLLVNYCCDCMHTYTTLSCLLWSFNVINFENHRITWLNEYVRIFRQLRKIPFKSIQHFVGALICHFSALDHGLLFMVSPN